MALTSEDYRTTYLQVLESFGSRLTPLEKLEAAVLIDILAALEQMNKDGHRDDKRNPLSKSPVKKRQSRGAKKPA